MVEREVDGTMTEGVAWAGVRAVLVMEEAGAGEETCIDIGITGPWKESIFTES